MSILRAIASCVERPTIVRLLQYQIVLAITAFIEAINERSRAAKSRNN